MRWRLAWRWLATAAFVLAAACQRTASPEPTPPAPMTPRDPVVLAVLPFSATTDGGDVGAYADGLADELIHILGRVDGLRVVSRASAFAFRGSTLERSEIGRQLHAGYLLHGRLQRIDDRLLLQVRLQRAADDRLLWSQDFDRRLNEVFAVQEQIARSVALALAATDDHGIVLQVPVATRDAAAYELYLRGRQLFAQRGEALFAARDALQEAVARDGEFAAAWAALAGTWYVLPTYRSDIDAGQAHRRARYAALRALQLDPNQVAALAVKSRLVSARGKRLRAAELLDRALQLDPNHANAWLWRGLTALECGHVGTARAAFAQARLLDPLSGIDAGWLGTTLILSGEVAAGRALLGEAASRGWAEPAALIELHLAAAQASDAELAERLNGWLDQARMVDALQQDLYRQIAEALRQPARRAAAREAIAAAIVAKPERDWSEAYLFLREPEAALDEALRGHAVMQPLWPTRFWMPAYRPLRESTRFLELAEQAGLAEYWQRHGLPDGCARSADAATLRCLR